MTVCKMLRDHPGVAVDGGRVVGRGCVRQVDTVWLGLSKSCFIRKTRGKFKVSSGD